MNATFSRQFFIWMHKHRLDFTRRKCGKTKHSLTSSWHNGCTWILIGCDAWAYHFTCKLMIHTHHSIQIHRQTLSHTHRARGNISREPNRFAYNKQSRLMFKATGIFTRLIPAQSIKINPCRIEKLHNVGFTEIFTSKKVACF